MKTKIDNENIVVNTEEQLKVMQEQFEMLEKRYNSLKEQKTLAIQVGELVIKSRKSIIKLIKLPFEILKVKKMYVSGKFKTKISNSMFEGVNFKIENSKNTILFMATNGVGLGHLTRCLAVARHMKEKIEVEQIIFLTTSPALHLVKNEGFIPFYVPSKEMFNQKITGTQWDSILGNSFEVLFSLYDIKTVVFDGAIPYQSLASVLIEKEDLLKIWIKRGSAKKSRQNAREEYEKIFDHIIIPSELGDSEKDTKENHCKVEPIVYLDSIEQMKNEDVRKFFGIQDNKRLVYVQLGAGKINDTSIVLSNVFDILKEYEDIIIIYGQSPLGSELKIINDKIRVLKDYPNSKYFNGFDFAISACGYNSFHELMSSSVPTIFLPNMNTSTDDQFARAKISEKYNCGIVLENPSLDELKEAIDIFANNYKFEEFKKNIISIPECAGAMQAADKILEYRKNN